MRKTATPGTIIHGTLRSEDLLPAFASELFYLNHEESDAIVPEVEAWVSQSDEAREADREAEVSLFERLETYLNECAPEGFYFGAHEGDGSDFGFWRCDDDE